MADTNESLREEEKLNKTFAFKLNYWLNQRGKTQADLVKKMQVSSPAVSDWCNGRKIPRANKLVSLASYLNVQLSDLLDERIRGTTELEELRFRLGDDPQFLDLVTKINHLSTGGYTRLLDYVDLLEKSSV